MRSVSPARRLFAAQASRTRSCARVTLLVTRNAHGGVQPGVQPLSSGQPGQFPQEQFHVVNSNGPQDYRSRNFNYMMVSGAGVSAPSCAILCLCHCLFRAQ